MSKKIETLDQKKLTRKQVAEDFLQFKEIDAQFFKNDKITLINTVFHAIKRCLSFSRTHYEFIEEFRKEQIELAKKECGYDEKNVDKSYIKDINEKINTLLKTESYTNGFKDVLNEEVSISYHEVSEDELDQCVIPEDWRKFLFDKIVTKD